MVHISRANMAHISRANMAHIRQSRPDSGLGVQVKAIETFQVVPSSFESGRAIPHGSQILELGMVQGSQRLFLVIDAVIFILC